MIVPLHIKWTLDSKPYYDHFVDHKQCNSYLNERLNPKLFLGVLVNSTDLLVHQLHIDKVLCFHNCSFD